MKTCIVLALALTAAVAVPLQHIKQRIGHGRPRILHGNDATRGQFPYMSIVENKDTGLQCGAAILSPTFVATAVSCIFPDGENFNIVAGKLHEGQDDSDIQKINVTGYVVHPSHDFTYYDLVLLELEQPLQFNDVVQPVTLPEPNENVSEGANATLTGWGLTDVWTETFPDTLQFLDMPIISNADCNAFYSQHGPYVFPVIDSQLCTMPNKDDQSACTFDLGGPLVQNGKLVGIISNNEDYYCGAAYPFPVALLYTRIGAVIDFIRQNVPDLP